MEWLIAALHHPVGEKPTAAPASLCWCPEPDSNRHDLAVDGF
jgi:hypothetical protein